MNSARYYQASGTAPVVGLMLALTIGLVGGALLSGVYALINYFNPFIYITFLATAGFGFGCGMVSVFAITVGKIRNRMLSAMLGLAIGFLSLYFAWVGYMYFVDLPRFPGGELIFDVTRMMGKIRVAAQEGLWSIRNQTPTGMFLYAVWVLEAGIVLGLSTWVPYLNDSPFCEECNAWCDEKECPVTFSMPADFDSFEASLEAGDLSPLFQSAQRTPTARTYLQATVYPCPACEETTWLKLEAVTVNKNDKGEEEKDETTLVNYLGISRADGDRLLKLGRKSQKRRRRPETEEGEGVPLADEE